MNVYFYFFENDTQLTAEGLLYIFELDPTAFLLQLFKGFAVYDRELKDWEVIKYKLKPFGKKIH